MKRKRAILLKHNIRSRQKGSVQAGLRWSARNAAGGIPFARTKARLNAADRLESRDFGCPDDDFILLNQIAGDFNECRHQEASSSSAEQEACHQGAGHSARRCARIALRASSARPSPLARRNGQTPIRVQKRFHEAGSPRLGELPVLHPALHLRRLPHAGARLRARYRQGEHQYRRLKYRMVPAQQVRYCGAARRYRAGGARGCFQACRQ